MTSASENHSLDDDDDGIIENCNNLDNQSSIVFGSDLVKFLSKFPDGLCDGLRLTIQKNKVIMVKIF